MVLLCQRLQALVAHHRSQVGPPDADVHDGLDALAGHARPLPRAHRGREVVDAAQGLVDITVDVLAVDLQLGGGAHGSAQRGVQHGAILDGVDVLAGEHRFAALLDADLAGQLQQQLDGLGGQQVLGKVHVQVGGGVAEALGPLRIVGEPFAHRAGQLPVMRLERLPGGGGGGIDSSHVPIVGLTVRERGCGPAPGQRRSPGQLSARADPDLGQLGVLARGDRVDDGAGDGRGPDQLRPVDVPGEQGSVRRAREDRGHTHPVVLHLGTQAVGQGPQGMLGGPVDGVARHLDETGTGVQHHDGPQALPQGGQGQPGQLGSGGHVEREGIGPVLGRRLLDAADRADRRGVDQRIDPLGEQAVVGELGEVGGSGLDAGCLLGELGQGVLAAGDGDHPPAQIGELHGGLAADPAARSGDHGSALLGGVLTSHGSLLEGSIDHGGAPPWHAGLSVGRLAAERVGERGIDLAASGGLGVDVRTVIEWWITVDSRRCTLVSHWCLCTVVSGPTRPRADRRRSTPFFSPGAPMAISRRSMMLGTAAGGAAMTLAACSGDDGGDGNGGGNGGGVILLYGSEPQNPLHPTNTNEVGGGRILQNVFSGLISYDTDGESVNEVAESIESEDSQHYTITLADGWTFHNGDPVTAQSFVDAWNYAANGANGQYATSFFESIEGYDEISGEDADPEATLSGLEVVDDLTFSVTLSSPQADFPIRLGYTAFSPLPQAFFDDPESFGESPIGNGPYQMVEWNHNQNCELQAYPDYPGPRTPANDGLDFVIYQDQETAYNDLLSGGVDVIDYLAPSALGSFESELGERAINQPAAGDWTFTIHMEDPDFSGEAGRLRRQAISMAIDRQEISEAIYAGTRPPATDFTTPVVNGFSEDIPGSEVLTFDEERAKELWAEAEEMQPFEGPFPLGYKADGGHRKWAEGFCTRHATGLGSGPSGTP